VTADHDHIRGPFGRGLHDFDPWTTDLEEIKNARLSRHPLAEIREELMANLLGPCSQLTCRNATRLGVAQWKLDDVNQADFGAERAGESCANIGRARRDWLTVDGNENLSKVHFCERWSLARNGCCGKFSLALKASE
jgi:hypothetical protein